MSVEVGEYKGFLYFVNRNNGVVTYEWNECKYLRFYELTYAIDKCISEGSK